MPAPCPQGRLRGINFKKKKIAKTVNTQPPASRHRSIVQQINHPPWGIDQHVTCGRITPSLVFWRLMWAEITSDRDASCGHEIEMRSSDTSMR